MAFKSAPLCLSFCSFHLSMLRSQMCYISTFSHSMPKQFWPKECQRPTSGKQRNPLIKARVTISLTTCRFIALLCTCRALFKHHDESAKDADNRVMTCLFSPWFHSFVWRSRERREIVNWGRNRKAEEAWTGLSWAAKHHGRCYYFHRQPVFVCRYVPSQGIMGVLGD